MAEKRIIRETFAIVGKEGISFKYDLDIAREKASQTQAQTMADVAKWLAESIIEWDMTEADEVTPLQISPFVFLQVLPVQIIKALSEAMVADAGAYYGIFDL